MKSWKTESSITSSHYRHPFRHQGDISVLSVLIGGYFFFIKISHLPLRRDDVLWAL